MPPFPIGLPMRFLHVEDADDVVTLAPVHRNPRAPRLVDDVQEIVGRDVERHGDHVATRRQHVAHGALVDADRLGHEGPLRVAEILVPLLEHREILRREDVVAGRRLAEERMRQAASDALLQRRQAGERPEQPAGHRAERPISARHPTRRAPGRDPAKRDQHRDQDEERRAAAAEAVAAIAETGSERRRRGERQLTADDQRDQEAARMAVQLVEEPSETARSLGLARDDARLRERRLGAREAGPQRERDGQHAEQDEVDRLDRHAGAPRWARKWSWPRPAPAIPSAPITATPRPGRSSPMCVTGHPSAPRAARSAATRDGRTANSSS